MIDHTLGPRVKLAREAVAASQGDAVKLLKDSKRFVRVISARTLGRIESGKYRHWEEKWTAQLKYLLERFRHP